ncbi:hypothetical protein ABH940_005553 [Streptacidiphilus sp. BW17]|uniref:hypothetical protein n=1 Tax=Streptacidiphilus sp. BW17 TaxID=3156274 RepID=UPI0035188906
MTAVDPSSLAQDAVNQAARALGVRLDTVPYRPLDPDKAPRWLADPEVTARLQLAIEDLLMMCANNAGRARFRVSLAQYSTEACSKAGVTAPYFALVEAEAAIYACSTMHLGPHAPLDHEVNTCLAAFELLPQIVQQTLLYGYAQRMIMCSECCAHPDDQIPTP